MTKQTIQTERDIPVGVGLRKHHVVCDTGIFTIDDGTQPRVRERGNDACKQAGNKPKELSPNPRWHHCLQIQVTPHWQVQSHGGGPFVALFVIPANVDVPQFVRVGVRLVQNQPVQVPV